MIHDLVMPQWVNGRIAQRTTAMKQPWTDSILRGFDRSRDTKTAPALTGSALEQAYRALLLENQVLTETNQRLQEQLLEADAKRDTSSSERQLIREQRNLIAERSHELRQQQYACKTLQRERDQLRENNSHLAQKTARLAAAAEAMKQQLANAQAQNDALQRELSDKKRDLATLTEHHYQLQAKHDPTMNTRRVINVDF
jgi:chromosome segregation ATPase